MDIGCGLAESLAERNWHWRVVSKAFPMVKQVPLHVKEGGMDGLERPSDGGPP